MGAFIVGGAYVLQFEESARFGNLKRGTLEYMRSHSVNFNSQIEVVHSLTETHQARQMKNQYESLMKASLPQELQTRISRELWSRPLLSLDLIRLLSEVHAAFLHALVCIVKEDVFASKTLIFYEGEHCSGAYHVLRGAISIKSTVTAKEIEPFRHGQWVGEKALISPNLY